PSWLSRLWWATAIAITLRPNTLTPYNHMFQDQRPMAVPNGCVRARSCHSMLYPEWPPVTVSGNLQIGKCRLTPPDISILCKLAAIGGRSRDRIPGRCAMAGGKIPTGHRLQDAVLSGLEQISAGIIP